MPRRPYRPAPRAGVTDPALESQAPAAEPVEETREERDARAQFARFKELTDLAAILADVRVREFLWRMISRTGMFAENFSPNASVHSFNAGRASVGRMMWGEIEEASHEALMQMLSDARAQRLEENADAQKGPVRSEPEG